jgi:hypothetical protein
VFGKRKALIMARSAKVVGAGALGIALALSGATSAETVHHRARHPAAAGRQITVHAGEPFLTAGVGASVGSRNRYVLDTLRPPYRSTVEGTFVGMRGDERLPNRFSVPGSNEPLFTF